MKSVRVLNGYRVIYIPEHPRAMKSKNWMGYVYEHIVVAEESLGRRIEPNEVVHHLNGKRDDNRSYNLLVLERNQHIKLHIWISNGKPYDSEAESQNPISLGAFKPEDIRKCVVCERIIQSSANKKCCSNKCRALDNRIVKRPCKEELKVDIESLSWVSIGKKYKVSDNAARKWARSYGLL